MALMRLDPTGRGRGRWTMRWKAALNAFDVTFDGRLSAGDGREAACRFEDDAKPRSSRGKRQDRWNRPGLVIPNMSRLDLLAVQAHHRITRRS
jgi:hypothetical protein